MNTDRPTLTLTVPAWPGTLAVQVDGYDSPPPYRSGRYTYAWRVTVDTLTFEGADLHSGTRDRDAGPDLADALRSLVSFLTADVERYDGIGRTMANHPEHADGYSFPLALVELASAGSSELESAAMELEPYA